jgi:hypothetical protein
VKYPTLDHKEITMKTRIALTALFFLAIHAPGPLHAAWSEPKEIISGTWGKGTGQLGIRSESGYDVVPKIEAVTADQHIVISDPANKKQLVFNGSGKFVSELKWDDKKGQVGKAVAPLAERARTALMVRSSKIGSGTYRITMVFPDKNVEVDSNDDFSQAVRDGAGYLYGISAVQASRFDLNGKQVESLVLPRAHEEIVPVPGGAPRALYIEYGLPVIAPNGDVYLWQRSGEKFSVLKWTRQ